MFENARLKLTAWYLVIIMAISITFSFAIYTGINAEFTRFERMHIRIQEEIKEGTILPHDDHFVRIGKPDTAFIAEARQRVIMVLGLINLAILFLAGTAGHFLAGRTLRPIKKNA